MGTACHTSSPVIQEEKLKLPELDLPVRRVIVLAGPTATGKSWLGLKIAKLLGGEIISADSMQVYRGMDLGTAKVSAMEQEEIPHHLIDIRHITEPFNVVDFCLEAESAIQSILARGRVPIIVGGSGFYLRSLLYGAPKGPPTDPLVRRQLEEELERKGSDLLYYRLQELDPVYASTITVHDKHKIVRGLEIIVLSHHKVSDFKQSGPYSSEYDFRCWFLHRPRASLYQRINNRCETMLEHGLIDEVIALEKEGLRQNSSAVQAIGYRQTLEYLATAQTRPDYERFVEALKAASRHYAKRQFTWFKKEPLFRWVDLDLYDPETVWDMIITNYQTLS